MDATTSTATAERICSVPDCTGITGPPGTAKGLCNKHYNRLRRHGDVSTVLPNRGPGQGPTHPLWKGAEASYKALHRRVYRARGKAAECVQCHAGGRKYEWATLHGTDGTDVRQYIPPCIPCHRTYDFARLTLEQREQIRVRVAAGAESQSAIARELGIHPSVVSRGLNPDARKWQTDLKAAS